jgi:Flp pilus assembly protein TadG
VAGFRRDDRGQSIVELALTVPLLVYGLIGGADLARAYALQLAVQNGARAGAEAAAVNQSPTTALAEAMARDEMDRTPGMDSDLATVNVTFAQSGGGDCLDQPTVANPCFVTVRVRYTFSTLVPWPLVPNTANFDRSTIMRTIAGPP